MRGTDEVLILLLLVLGISIWIGWTWLAVIDVFVMFLIFIGESKTTKTKSKAAKSEEILTPVIVTDEGEPPYLYPDKFKLKVYTGGWGTGGWMEAASGAASLAQLAYGLVTGKTIKGYSWDTRWDVGKIRKGKKKNKKDGKK